MITTGKYTVWFRTPVGEGTGVVDFGSNGELCGGDTTFSYAGHWEQDRERFSPTRHCVMMLLFADLRRANPWEELAAAAIILAAGRMRGGGPIRQCVQGGCTMLLMPDFEKGKLRLSY